MKPIYQSLGNLLVAVLWTLGANLRAYETGAFAPYAFLMSCMLALVYILLCLKSLPSLQSAPAAQPPLP